MHQVDYLTEDQKDKRNLIPSVHGENKWKPAVSATVTTNAGAIEKTGLSIATALPVTCRKVPLAVFSPSLLETLCAYVLMSKI